ncbi:MAG: HAD-IA family hydrolase [Hydrogenophaga sp.]|uniref:HAD-IA family hydrolase n=1 Tax=Hydrogenophaga sp. TaxID=1904254 RepID=UPI001D934B39|nr:HAD-IA family hydrolase [Hydrogenophaga sp.]MBX3608467.1 HAD-IA family hydrolase [Hydrogenophaga sp.]
MSFGAIFFDLDGTLVETAPEIADAVNDTLRDFQRPAVSQRQVDDWIGHGTRELLVQALAFTDRCTTQAVRESAQFARIEQAFGAHYRQRCGTRSRLYPRVRETLQGLRSQGVRLVVLTNKESRYTEVVLDAHGLTPLFDRVVSGDTLGAKKPDPVGIVDSLHRFGLGPRSALMVGDSSIDVNTARKAGVAVWAVPYGYNMGQPIEQARPDRVIPDISALLA